MYCRKSSESVISGAPRATDFRRWPRCRLPKPGFPYDPAHLFRAQADCHAESPRSVNQRVVGSSPTPGAIKNPATAGFFVIWRGGKLVGRRRVDAPASNEPHCCGMLCCHLFENINDTRVLIVADRLGQFVVIRVLCDNTVKCPEHRLIARRGDDFGVLR
jgi:hypothetical protein